METLISVVVPARNAGEELSRLLAALAAQTIDRDRFIELLAEANIGTSVHFIPLHLHPYYQRRWGYTVQDMPVASMKEMPARPTAR